MPRRQNFTHTSPELEDEIDRELFELKQAAIDRERKLRANAKEVRAVGREMRIDLDAAPAHEGLWIDRIMDMILNGRES